MSVPSQRIGRAALELLIDKAQYSRALKLSEDELKAFATRSQATYKNMTQGMSAAGQQMATAQRVFAQRQTDSAKLLAGLGQAGQQARVSASVAQQANAAHAWAQARQRDALAVSAAEQKAAQTSLGWTGRLQQWTTQAGAASKASSVLSSAFGQVFAGFAAANLLSNAVGFIGNLGREAVKTAGDLVDMSNRTGQSIESLQRQAFVAKQTGSSLEGYGKAAFQLGIRVEGATKELRAQIEANDGLRLSYQQLKAMKPDEQFEAVLEALSKIEDPQKRNALAVKLFGKTAAEVLPAVAEGYQNIAKQAMVASDAQVRAVDNASDAWDAFLDRTGKRFTQTMGRMVLAAQEFFRLDWNGRLNAIANFARSGNFSNAFNQLADAGTKQADIMAARASLAAQKQRELAKAMEFGAGAAKSYAVQLAETQKKIAGLTPTQRAEILAADKLGVSLEDLSGKYNDLSEEGLKLFIAGTKKSATAMSEAEKIANKYSDQIGDLRDRLSGGDAINAVELLMAAYQGSIPIATMAADAQREVAKTLYAGVDAWRAQGVAVPAAVQLQVDAVERLRVIPDILKDITKFTREFGAEQTKIFRQWQAEQAADTGTNMLAAIRDQVESRRSTSAAIEDLELRRTEVVIEQAKQQGVAWQQVYDMERGLAQRRLQATLRDLEVEHQARMSVVDQSTPIGQDAAAAMEADYRAHIEAMVADFEWGEQQKRRELERTHNFWLNLYQQIKDGLRDLQLQATANLSRTLFGFGHDPDGSLKKAAKEAREAYEELTKGQNSVAATAAAKAELAKTKLDRAQQAFEDAKKRGAGDEELSRLNRLVLEARVAFQEVGKAGEGSAKDIQEAFDRMREAEEEANFGWAKRFTELWRGVQRSLVSIFDGILQAFTTRLLDGMINAILGKKGGFAGAFSGLMDGGLSGLLGKGAGAAAGVGAAGAAGTATVVAPGITAVAGSGAAGGVGVAATGGGAAAGGGAGAGGAAGAGIGTAATIGITGGIAGAALLAWGIAKKGLFRGGWEGIKGNQRRDQQLAQWGPPGTGPGSGFANVAAFLTSKTGEPGGGSLFKDLMSGDKQRFESAQAALVQLAQKAGKKVQAFHTGGLVPGYGEQMATVLGGEGVLSRRAMSSIGVRGLEALNHITAPALAMPQVVQPRQRDESDGAGTSRDVHLTFNVDGAIDGPSFIELIRKRAIPELKMALVLNDGQFTQAIAGNVVR